MPYRRNLVPMASPLGRGKSHLNEVDTGDCPREQKRGKWARAKQGKGLGYILADYPDRRKVHNFTSLHSFCKPET